MQGYNLLMKNNGKQRLAPMQVHEVYDFVSHFKQVGGSFDSLFKRLSGIEDRQAFLCDMLEQLEKPENSELKQIFQKTLASSDYARRLLVRDKAWIMAEQWQNLSETSNAAEISYQKHWLPEIKVFHQAEAEQNEVDEMNREELEEMANVERQMSGEDEEEQTDSVEDEQYQRQYNSPGCFPPTQSAEDEEMAEVEKRLAIRNRSLISPDEYRNRVSITGLPPTRGVLA